MCLLHCKLCYCKHRSWRQWAFCADSLRPLGLAPNDFTSEQAKPWVEYPCPLAFEYTKPVELCQGRADYCCSRACCRIQAKTAEDTYELALSLLKRRSEALGKREYKRQTWRASNELFEGRDYHEACAEKRNWSVRRLREEQPCLFKVDERNGYENRDVPEDMAIDVATYAVTRTRRGVVGNHGDAIDSWLEEAAVNGGW